MNQNWNQNWNQRYLDKDTPWAREEADELILELLHAYSDPSTSVLEVGCGNGVESVALVKNGFKVLGIDLSEEAIRLANQRKAKLEKEMIQNLNFECANFFEVSKESLPNIGLVVDRACFHVFNQNEEMQRKFAQKTFELLPSKGFWINLTVSADNVEEYPKISEGEEVRIPPMMSFKEIMRSVEDYFRLVEVRSTSLNVNREGKVYPFLAWCSVFRKRKI